MSKEGTRRGQVIWEVSDFTKHGMVATYFYGQCRCEKCVERWESWEPYPTDTYKVKRQMLRR